MKDSTSITITLNSKSGKKVECTLLSSAYDELLEDILNSPKGMRLILDISRSIYQNTVNINS